MADVERGDYLDNEVDSIYELGHFFLENGDLRSGEILMDGLTQVAPEFYPAWLGMAYVALLDGALEIALRCAEQAVKLAPHSIEALLYLVVCSLSSGDYNKAGTYLGEVGEKVDNEEVVDPQLIRFYRAQLIRYQNR